MGTSHEKSIAEKYADELLALRLNSKPLINSLTMMAEDYIKQAPEIVLTIEKHLMRAKPDVKLPNLYLIDSIVKNVKREYVQLFTQNIVSTFCSVFEQVDIRTRAQMFKLRQTWNDIFPTKKLYAIDVRIHEVDPNWPVQQSSSIHVNPKFLTKAMSASSTSTLPVATESRKPSASSTSTSKTELNDEEKMREELLIKQKELIELQQKKLELEIMQGKAKLAERDRLKQLQGQTAIEEQLLRQAEMAKKQTDKAASIIAKAGSVTSKSSNSNSARYSPNDNSSTYAAQFPQDHKVASAAQTDTKERNLDPRLARRNNKRLSPSPEGSRGKSYDERKSPKKNRLESPERQKPEAKDNQMDDRDQKRKRRKYVDEIESPKSKSGRDKSRESNNKSSPDKADKTSRDSPKSKDDKNRIRSDSSEKKRKLELDDVKSRSSSKDSKERTSSRSPGPGKTDEKSEKAEKINVRSENESEEKEPKSKVERKDKEKDNYISRKSAVLSRNYRKKADSTVKEEGNLKKLSSDSTPLDTDLRFQGLQDVDLRDTTDAPAAKKSRKTASYINDLFGFGLGGQDVDLRPDSSWSEVKKPAPKLDDSSQSLEESRPPSAVSPANSVDSIRSSCDPLGRPLIFTRLPIDPEERKRSLDTRSLSIDPVDQFRLRFLERPGGLTAFDVKIAFKEAKTELDSGVLNSEQHSVIMKQLIQLNEVQKIRELQETRGPALNPWGGNIWSMDGTNTFQRARFPSPDAWGVNQWQGVPTVPVGPNPFVEAAAAIRPPPEDLIPETNPLELQQAERDAGATIPLDKVIRDIRFYGDTAIVFLGIMNEEPREISFQKSDSQFSVQINNNKSPFKYVIGENRVVYIDKIKHRIRIGTPKRELFIDDQGYEACFGGRAVRVNLDGRMNYFRLVGSAPKVEIGQELRYDLVAGRVIIYVDTSSVPVFLDEKPQILELGGVPVILKFSSDFHHFKLNGRLFSANFGGPAMSVSLLNGRQHFLRFAQLSPAAARAIRIRQGIPPNFPFHGRGGRGRIRGESERLRNPFADMPNSPSHQDDRMLQDNPLDVIATTFPSDSKENENQNAYKSENVDESSKTEEGSLTKGLQDLMRKLAMAGMLPSNNVKKEAVADPVEVSDPITPKEEPVVEVKPEVEVKKEEQVAPPVQEFVEVTFNDSLKERREKLINLICAGVQCGSCGLRFPPDQSLRYTQHLDWHFRLNRREKANSRKAQSRKWYYDLSDWIQFEEIEDLEERAASLFEFQEPEKPEGDEKDMSTILNPDAYTVIASGFEQATCPQCGEGFETFYDSEEDEWKLRDAVLDKEVESEPKIFHPICHEDYVISLAKQAAEPEYEPMEVMEAQPESESSPAAETELPEPAKKESEDKPEAEAVDDDEVLILKEGKKEVVLMEIDIDDEEPSASTNKEVKNSNEKMSVEKIENEKNETENNNNLIENVSNNTKNDSNTKLAVSPIVIQVEDDYIPGLTNLQDGSGVFDFALSSGGENAQNSESDLPLILYKSMQFDFPKIKTEPPEWDSVDENQVIMSKEYLVDSNQEPMDITLDDDDSPSQPQVDETSQKNNNFDVDLTVDDDEASSQSMQSNSLVSAIDGNMEMRSEAKAPLLSVPTKIRINISGLDNRAGSQSPGKQSSSQEEGSSSITSSKSPQHVSNDNKSSDNLDTNNINEKRLEEIKRLKPRLVGKKLVNCPPRKTGKEESGLCTIC